MEWTIQSLSQTIAGRLKMAAMPPLGGHAEPVGRLVSHPDHLAPGDVLIVSQEIREEFSCCEIAAFHKGALGVVGENLQGEPWPGGFFLEVEDIAWGTWQLARESRAEYEGQVIAVSGSVGKTTTAALIAAVLGMQASGSTAQADQSVANQLLNLSSDDRFAVIEVNDASVKIDAALHLACPHVVVSIDPHDPDQKCGREDDWRELSAALPDDGRLVIGPDLVVPAAVQELTSVASFGRRGSCDVSPTHVLCTETELRFVIHGQVATLHASGRHFLDNALAAWCVARALGIDDRTIASRLQRACVPSHRCELVQISNLTFIDDTASRCDFSLKAALQLLDSMNARRHVVVCGTEGAFAGALGTLGQRIVDFAGADVIIAVADERDEIARGAIDAGMPRGHCHRCASSASAEEISTFLRPGDVVLFTGVDAQLPQRVLALFQNAAPVTAMPDAA